MKKLLAILMAMAMVMTILAGCAKKNETESQSENQTESQSQDTESEKEADQTDSEYVIEKGKLVVGITDFAPMDYQEDGKWVGFDAELSEAFAKELGVACEFIEIEWDSKTMELDNKNIDCVWNGMTLTDGVKAAMETSKPYLNNAQIIVVKKDKADSIKTAEDAKALKFAVEGGSAGEEAAKANEFEYTAVGTQADAVMEVSAGTAEACIIDSLMAAAMVGEGTDYPDLAYTVGLTEEEYGVGFRKGSDLAAKLNDFFKKAYDDGTLLAIAEKYGTQASLIEQ